jgi:hypothetical protein
MSIEDPTITEGPHEPDTSAAEIAAGGGSVLDRIKKRRSSEADELDLGIPSWGGELIATYQVLHRSEIEKMVKRITARQRNQGKKADTSSGPDLDFLIKACIAVKAHDNETDEEEFLTPGYTMALAGMFDPQDEFGNPIDISTPSELLAYLMKNNSIAIASHSQKVARWMQDTSQPVEDPS